MPRVRRSEKAAEDLEEIFLYVAIDNVDAAEALLDQIDDACQLLAKMPRMGRSREELGPSLHSFPVGDYVIFYRPVKGGIEVARFLHGARDVDALF